MKSQICLTKNKIENTVLEITKEIDKKNNNVLEWSGISESDLFVTLVSCILGSRVRYETSHACVKYLKERRLLEISFIINKPKLARRKIYYQLKKRIYPPFKDGNGRRYLYAKSKSQYIVQTCQNIYYKQNTTIKDMLKTAKGTDEARDLLMYFCKGIGPKQASLFLRDIGYSIDLAILDTHVLKYMDIVGLVENRKMKTLTKKVYYNYEDRLVEYANSLNKSLSSLDLAIWVVMNVLESEFKWVM